MKDYLNAKVAEYSFLLDWMDGEIRELQARNTNHPYIVTCLQGKMGELRQLHNRLRIIARVGSDRLAARANPIIHDIEYQILLLTCHYIPGLQRENADDIFIRDLVLSVKRRCGLGWIEDVLVRLDSHHAIFPVIPEIPVIFAPPHHVASTLDMAAIYHELGHDVFQRFKEIGENLGAAVFLYFFKLKQDASTMDPEKQRARNNTIKNALDYWNMERLNEIFSDIYAAHVCGPAYYFSCVDIVLRFGRNPFLINPIDVHPPWAVRVYACHKTLLPIHQNDEVVSWIDKIWDSYTPNQLKDAAFDMICASGLINQLVDLANQNIQRFLPDVQRYSEAIPDSFTLEGDFSAESLEKILNNRLRMLLTKPGRYAEWEKNVFDIFRKSGSEL